LSEGRIYGEWSGAAHHQGCEARDIEQVDLKARRSELRAGRRHADELYRAETVGEVHGKHRHQQRSHHRQTNNGHGRLRKHSGPRTFQFEKINLQLQNQAVLILTESEFGSSSRAMRWS